MKTIHLIFNAHIDPVWLWPWEAGLDAAIATCRSACDRLDRHRDIFFTRGEAWIYQQIQVVDPPLFNRIRKLVANGRWEIVGGWWIQPDCNLPSGFAMRKQIELGQRYFTKTFGQFPVAAYNVDSFGHAAALPGLMRAFGQTRYVMMRPQEHEKRLPARLFRWRGYEGGPEVVTFRIAGAYTTRAAAVPEHVLASTSELPSGVEHTMCFIGVGDHGGGPTEEQIAYLKEHRNAFDGWRLEFSTVRRFFDAIESQVESLPLVTGELQHHAVGCYSVQRSIKTAVRHAEHRLAQAEIMLHSGTRPLAGSAAQLDLAWRDVCFNHFHDTLGGTCVPTAYQQVEAQLGRASAIADDIVQHMMRRKLNQLKKDPLQRMALFNASERPIDSHFTLFPWLEWRKIAATTRILDEDDQPIDFQFVPAEPLVTGSLAGAVLLRMTLAAKQLRVLRIDPHRTDETAAATPNDALATGFTLRAGDIALDDAMHFGPRSLPLPHLALMDDLSDTWGHGVTRFSDEAVNHLQAGAPTVIARGLIMAMYVADGTIGSSRVRMEWRVHRDWPWIELRLMVLFVGRHKVLKLVLPLPSRSSGRLDGVMDGSLRRANDGHEYPLRDWTRLDCDDGSHIGIVAPDCFALDCDGRTVRFTLVRSPLMAHHIPHQPPPWQGIYADQGRHFFRFWFGCGEMIDVERMEEIGVGSQRDMVYADVTKGMGD